MMDKNFYDLIVVGAGPAGIAAAIYMARAKYSVLVLEKEEIGGQINITAEIVNYPGIQSTSGPELMSNMKKQAEHFGAEFMMATVTDMKFDTAIKTVHTDKGDYKALGIILATGANPRKLGFSGEKEFQGRGVAYCATCDGEFFTGKQVFVIGGGFAAAEEGMFLTKYASQVTIVVREEDFTCAKTVADKVKAHDKIKVVYETEIIEVNGTGILTSAKFRNNRTGEITEYKDEKGFGVFVFAGYVPDTKWMSDEVAKDEQGYIITDMNRKTNLPGVYAAGDVCVKNLRQVVTAVADGAIAATSLELEIAELHEKLELPDEARPAVNSDGQENKELELPDEIKDVAHSDETQRDQYNHLEFVPKEFVDKLTDIFSKFESDIYIRLWRDNSNLSKEMERCAKEVAGLTDRIRIRDGAEELGESYFDISFGENGAKLLVPAMEIGRENGKNPGIYFHGVPGGHEFNSFIMALYNTAGPGTDVGDELIKKIKKIDTNINIKVLVTLSCNMCPETVMAACRLATLSDYITTEMIDIMRFEEIKNKYNVMSVPCVVINDKAVYFGKKKMEELVELICNNENP